MANLEENQCLQKGNSTDNPVDDSGDVTDASVLKKLQDILLSPPDKQNKQMVEVLSKADVTVLEQIGRAVEGELSYRRDRENLFLKLPPRERTRFLGFLSGDENMVFNYSMVNRSGRRALMAAYQMKDKYDTDVGAIYGFKFHIKKLPCVEYRHLEQEQMCPGLCWAKSKGITCLDYSLVIPGVEHDEHLSTLIKTGRLKLAKHIIKRCKKSYDINSGDKAKGWTALHVACYWNEVDIVKQLCGEKGINVGAKDILDGQAPLHHVAIWGFAEVAQILIEEGGADVNAVDKYGMTPVHKVCRNNCVAVAKLLVASGKANLEAQDIHGVRPMHKACLRGHVEMAKFLVEHGALLNPLEKTDKSPLDLARNNERADVFAWLKSCGALTGQEALRRMKGENYYSMHHAVKDGDVQLIKSLANQCSVNVHMKDRNDETPLHIAARFNQEEAASYLIVEGGADVNVVDKNGWTPLHEAAKYGHNGIINLLLSHAAHVNELDSNNKTAAAVAFNAGNIETAKLLADSGAVV